MENLNDQTTNDLKSGNFETHVIYRYNDLSFGKLCSVNREIRKAHVRKILRGLEGGSWNRLGQIYVDRETHEIVDGNHRFQALSLYFDKYGSLKGNKVDVIYYQREKNESLADAIKFFNNDRKPLTSKDFTGLSEANGNEAIPIIRQFGMEHDLTAKKDTKGTVKGYSERYTYAFLYGRNVTKEVKEGTIDIDDKIIEQGNTLYNEVEKMISASNLKVGYWIEQFVQAWYELRINNRLFINQFNKINFDDFVEQIAEDSKDWSMDKVNKSDWNSRFNSAIADLID